MSTLFEHDSQEQQEMCRRATAIMRTTTRTMSNAEVSALMGRVLAEMRAERTTTNTVANKRVIPRRRPKPTLAWTNPRPPRRRYFPNDGDPNGAA